MLVCGPEFRGRNRDSDGPGPEGTRMVAGGVTARQCAFVWDGSHGVNHGDSAATLRPSGLLCLDRQVGPGGGLTPSRTRTLRQSVRDTGVSIRADNRDSQPAAPQKQERTRNGTDLVGFESKSKAAAAAAAAGPAAATATGNRPTGRLGDTDRRPRPEFGRRVTVRVHQTMNASVTP